MLVVAVAAFLPWVSFFGMSAVGVEGDGVITLGLAVVGLVVLVLTAGVVGKERTQGRASQIVLLVLASFVAFVGFFDMNSFAAIGLYLTMFAGVVWLVGAIWQMTLPRQDAVSPADEPQL